MQPISGFEQAQPVHGRRNQQPLRGGTYAVVITAASEDLTGYGNQCLKIAYDITHGEHAGRFSDIAADPEQNWKHQFEVDVQEMQGGRLRTFVEAVEASNPGYAWDWNEAGLVGKHVGIVLQERLQTNQRGRRKGQTSSYLDFWDAVPVTDVLSGAASEVPPVNDRRTNAGEQEAQPVAVPQTFGQQQQQPVAQPMAQQPIAQPQQPVAQPYQVPQPQQQQQPYQVPVQQPQQPNVYDKDIPF